MDTNSLKKIINCIFFITYCSTLRAAHHKTPHTTVHNYAYTFDATYDIQIADTLLQVDTTVGNPHTIMNYANQPADLSFFTTKLNYTLNGQKAVIEVLPRKKTFTINGLESNQAGIWHEPLKRLSQKTYHLFQKVHKKIKDEEILKKDVAAIYTVIPRDATRMYALYAIDTQRKALHIDLDIYSKFESDTQGKKYLVAQVDIQIKDPRKLRYTNSKVTFKYAQHKVGKISQSGDPLNKKQYTLIKKITKRHFKRHSAFQSIHKKMTSV